MDVRLDDTPADCPDPSDPMFDEKPLLRRVLSRIFTAAKIFDSDPGAAAVLQGAVMEARALFGDDPRRAMKIAVQYGLLNDIPAEKLVEIFDQAAERGVLKKEIINRWTIADSARATINAGFRWPRVEDGIIQCGPLADGKRSWADAEEWLKENCPDLSDNPSRLAHFLAAENIFEYKLKYEGTLTHEKIIETGWAIYRAIGKRMTNKDLFPILHGPLAGTGLNAHKIDAALLKGRHSLKGGEHLTGLLTAAKIPKVRTRRTSRPSYVPRFKDNYRGTLNHKKIINTCWAYYEATGQRLTERDTDPIVHGDLAGTGLTGCAVDGALRHGFHGLPGKQTLAELQSSAGIPGGCYTGFLTYLDIVHTDWVFFQKTGKHISRADISPIEEGSLAGTGLTGCAIDNALRRGLNGLPGGESIGKIVSQAEIGALKITHKKIIMSAWEIFRKTSRRMTRADMQPVTLGPLQGTGLTPFAINEALQYGRYGLPGGESLSQILNAAGIPSTRKRNSALPPRTRRRKKPASEKASTKRLASAEPMPMAS